MITAATLRQSYPEFASVPVYPDAVVGYYIALAEMLLTARWGVGATAAASPPTTTRDFGLELFVAHHLVLEKRAMDAAAAGGTPGQVTGPVSSKSVGPASVSYDTGAVRVEEAGHWNLTVYGLRFARLSRMRGAGPVQVGVGCGPPYSSGAWSGPPPWPGWFSS